MTTFLDVILTVFVAIVVVVIFGFILGTLIAAFVVSHNWWYRKKEYWREKKAGRYYE